MTGSNGIPPSIILFSVCVGIMWLLYGSSVRKGVFRGRGILWAGIFVTLLTEFVTYMYVVRPFLGQGAPLPLILANPAMMLVLGGFCIGMSYRQQRVVDVGTYAIGDTKFIVRVCPPTRIPDVDALILPVNTALRLNDRLSRLVGEAAGPEVATQLSKMGPVGIGKVVSTSAGNLAAGRIVHVAVSDPGRPVDGARLRKGLENALQQARKTNAESIAVPVGPHAGIPMQESFEAPVAAALRHRKAFAEVVFVVFDPRAASLVNTIVNTLVAAEKKPEALARRN